jgi:glycosyltransferase involved in cell wall biosynthesis
MIIGSADEIAATHQPDIAPEEWPTVSVVVRTRERSELLRQAAQSVLDQRYDGQIELLIVFDRQDPVEPDLHVPDHRRVRLLTNDRTPGPAGAYNAGLLAATGTYFASCDDDDEWLPDKLSIQVELLERHPSALVATCGIYLGDDSSRTRNPMRVPKKEVLTVDDLLTTARNALHTSTYIVRLDRMLRDVGLLDEEIPGGYGEDFDWLLRSAAVAPVLAVPQPLVRVRWQYSHFAGRWQTILDSLQYQLQHRPEFHRQRRNLARVYGRMAFAQAALGQAAAARRTAWRSIRLEPLQPRGYLACLVSWGLIKADWVVHALHAMGRGV